MSLLAAASADDAVFQIVQVVGALCVLAGFAAAQFGVLRLESVAYLALNLVGSSVLAALAALDAQLGFLLLEAVWAVVSAWSLVKLYAKRGSTSAA
jgi:hypothetical protein